MKPKTLFFFGLVFALALIQAYRADAASSREPNPRMGALTLPFESGTYRLRIELPAGVPLCGMIESYSSMEWFYVPVDPATRCEQFKLPLDWEKWPDFIVIGPYVDTPLVVDTLDDYIKRESFFCQGEHYGAPARERLTEEPTKIEKVGKLLLELETASCTRDDAKSNRYSKALLAYDANPNGTGHGYMVGAYVHMPNKRAADGLLDQIVKLLK
jgi:hypothetical protein